MRVLIVDDSPSRRGKLISHLRNHGGYSEDTFCEVDCLDRARDAIKREYFDVMVLDVVIPKRSGGSPDASLGIDLLKVATTSPRYKCPEKIIGITAHLDDISNFRESFLEYCAIVIEAKESEQHWLSQVLNTISHTSISKISRKSDASSGYAALTIHGIQTFGAWQRRLRILARNNLGKGEFYTYRYGVFSIFAFLLPPLRSREVKRLKKEMLRIFSNAGDKTFAIYCHSFGTFLVYKALKELCRENHSIPVHRIIMAGSVLKSGSDLRFLRDAGICLVNDCADHDYVLYLSQAFVLGTGMAGKCGFYGIDDATRINRYFLGGHSSYFSGDEFMKRYWLPLLDKDFTADEEDQRSHSKFRHNVADRFLNLVGYFKPLAYIAIIAFGLSKAMKLF